MALRGASDAESIRGLIAEAPIVVFTLNPDGVFTQIEGGGLDAVGMDIRAALGQSVFDVFEPGDDVARNCRRALTGERFTAVVSTGDRSFETRYSPLFDSDGALSGTVGVSLEVTARERALAELRGREERYRAFIEHAHDSIVEIDPDGKVLYATRRFSEITGYPHESIVGRRGLDFVHPDDFGMVDELRIHAMETESEVELIFRFRHGDGSWRWLELGGRPFRTSDDELRAVLMIRDVTPRIRLEKERLEHLALETRIGELSRRLVMVDSRDLECSVRQELEAAATMAGADRCYLVALSSGSEPVLTFEWATPGCGRGDAFYSKDTPGRHTWVTSQMSRGEVVRLADIEALPDEAAPMRDELRASGARSLLLIPVLDGARLIAVMGLQTVRAAKDWSDQEVYVLRLAAGLFTSALRRRGAEDALKASEERFRALSENAQDAIAEIGVDGTILYANPSYQALLGYSLDELRALRAFETVHPNDREQMAAVHRASAAQPGIAGTMLYRGRRRDGTERRFEASGRGFQDPTGEFRMVAVIRDVTDRERGQRALERQLSLEKQIAILSRRFLALSPREIDAGIFDGVAAVGGLAEVDRCWLVPIGENGRWSASAYGWNRSGTPTPDADMQDFAFSGYPWSDTHADADTDASRVIHVPRVGDLPDEAERERTALQRRGTLSFLGIPLHSDRGVVGFMGLEALDAERTWDDEMIRLLRLVGEIFVSALNRKRAEVALANSQAQLMQSQKMEAIGTLAGGIAHDFNNQLAVILGNARHLVKKLGPEIELRESLEDLERAAEHCADLTKSLLAFSRQTPVEPRPTDLQQVLRDVRKLLAPLIASPIGLDVDAANDLDWVMADPTQLQQVIVNLAVNARDAMPDGGELLLRARNVRIGPDESERLGLATPGRYAMISVSDTGIGMDERTQGRIFDPFFTTKPPGKGTGLGLATTYGIVQESHGAIDVESAPGAGTTFRVLFPCAGRQGDEARRETAATILLVDDEDPVRRLVDRQLSEQGYEVLQATDGIDALRISQDFEGPIDILVSDLVMPNLSGEDLAQRLLLSRPEMRVLFISGYSERNPDTPGVRLLPKPFTERELLGCVRDLLDRTPRTRADREQS